MFLSQLEKAGVGLVLLQVFLIAILLNYAYDTVRYLRAHARKTPGQLPPKYPTLIPYLGHTIPFLWNGDSFLRRAASYSDQFTSTKVSFLPYRDIYFFQDRDTIKQVWKQSSVFTNVPLRSRVVKQLLGLHDRAVAIYREDNSGPHVRPIPGSSVPPAQRIHHMVHESTSRALNGPGSAPTLRRFKDAFVAKMADLPDDEWIEMQDFHAFTQDTVGASFLQAIYGPSMMQVNPTFPSDVFEFDHAAPWLLKGIPRFAVPAAYRVRARLRDQLKSWYAYARRHFHESSIYPDGDGDPFWGSAWMRNRQTSLSQVFDDDALASLDLGLAWGALGSMVTCAMLAVAHVAQDQSLLRRLRDELDDGDIDPKRLLSQPLLCSVYAETLRLHTKPHIAFSSPHCDVVLGKWRVPQNATCIVNAGLAHMDRDFWNTKGGAHPVESFWADRFIVDPSDPSSGPIRPDRLDGKAIKTENLASGRPFFSMQGLEGSWIPYGGGRVVCPGRSLAKNVILFTCAVFIRYYDVEILKDTIEFTSHRFGLGVDEPKHRIPFRIRKRR